MAQLKSSIVTGSLRVTDAVLTDTVQASTVKVPTTSGGTTYGTGDSGQVLTTNGTSVYWGSLPEGVSPSTTTPKMDGTATVGTETAFARGDHIHPTDTSRAPLASPALTGTPTAPTAASGTNTTQIATTAFVKAAVDAKSVPSASSTTPKMDGTAAVGTETAFARGDHVHPTDTSRAPLASPALTGTPTAPTATAGTNTTQIATTAFVKTAVDGISVPVATTTTPKMDGTAAVGSETKWAKGDHVHPTDTSRAASSHAHGNITNAGAITATGVALENNDTLVFVDSSDSSKLKQTSIKFDGSTATKALTQKGTFETFLTQHQDLSAYAPLASPALTGTPTAPTADYETNSTQIATTEYVDTARKSSSIEYIVGTQTASTASWTGATVDSALYVGKTIAYKLPIASKSGAVTLNLTLADGETKTGAKTVLINASANVGTSYGANSIIHMTYDGTNWRIGDYYISNSDSQAYLIRYGQNIFYPQTALYRYQILFTYDDTHLVPANAVSNSKATTKTLTSEPFDPFGQVYYYNTTTTVATTTLIPNGNLWVARNDVDLQYGFNTGTTLTVSKFVYLVCVPQANGKVVLHTTAISQSLPTTEDGLVYKLLGKAYSTSNIQMFNDKPCYYFKDGAIRQWTNPTAVIETKESVPSTESSPIIKVGSAYYLWK